MDRTREMAVGRPSDVRPEVFADSFQTSEGEYQHAFLFPGMLPLISFRLLNV